MYHVWTDIKGIVRLYKPAKGDKRPLLQRVADEYEKVCSDFRANDEIGRVFPTPAEVHILTRVKGVGYQSEKMELTGSRDPKFFQMFMNIRCTASEYGSKPLVVVSDSSMKYEDRSVAQGTMLSFCGHHTSFVIQSD
eukprot:5065671-Amphidinium_carterae.1